MSEKVVLPKFDLPGKQMHPAVKLLWMVGGFVRRQLIKLDQPLHQRVITRDLFDAVHRDQLGAAVAHMRDAKVATTSGRHHGGHHGAAKGGAKATVAKGGADDKAKPASKPGKKGDDVVDKLLASFK